MTSPKTSFWTTLTAVFVVISLIVAVMGAAVYFAYSTQDTPNNSEQINTEDLSEQPLVDAPIFITTMMHMEGKFKDDVDYEAFMEHVNDLRFAMDLFDEYGAKMTLESEQSFAKANTNWGLNFLQEMIDRGHGVGTHADFGAGSDIPLGKYISLYAANKRLVDDLVGAQNNRGVSGGFGAGDWVTAALRAGFDYIDGVVGYAYLSMPLSERPDGWTDEYIRATAYHDPIPTNLAERIYFFDLADSDNLEPDETGLLTISGGELGELASLAEGRNNCRPSCEFDEADIQVVVNAIETAIATRDVTRVAKINMHIPPSLLVPENEEILRKFFSAIKTYVDNGSIKWATQREAYEFYEDWENISH